MTDKKRVQVLYVQFKVVIFVAQLPHFHRNDKVAFRTAMLTRSRMSGKPASRQVGVVEFKGRTAVCRPLSACGMQHFHLFKCRRVSHVTSVCSRMQRNTDSVRRRCNAIIGYARKFRVCMYVCTTSSAQSCIFSHAFQLARILWTTFIVALIAF